MPPLPENEATRLQTLRDYAVLDTPPEGAFDDLALLASRICGSPSATVSLIDAERQWFKARVGVSFSETPRDLAFCAHAILQKDVFVVPDALKDPLFAENPLVTREPGIRFYAGAPLIAPDGSAIGTLCVFDAVPRELAPEQAEALRALAREVVAQLELRRVRRVLDAAAITSRQSEEALRASEELKTRIIEGSRDCIKLLDLEGRLLSMNAGGREALEICDFSTVANQPWVGFWEDPQDRAAAEAAIAAARAGGMGQFVGYFETVQNRKPRWFDVVVSPILDAHGKPERLLAVSRDVTDRKRSEDLFRSLTESTVSSTGADYFRALVEHISRSLHVAYAFVTECLDGGQAVRTLAVWQHGRPGENFEYSLSGTPCEAVIDGEVCFHPDNLIRRFPRDLGLVDWNAQSFLGIPMIGRSKAVVGHIAIMDERPMDASSLEIPALKIFAARAAAELERLKTQEELEALKNRLQAENVYLQEEIRTEHNFEEIVGNSPALVEALGRIEKVAATDATVLIQGETGTGKELFARAIHSRSARKGRPLVKVNCGAIPDGLVESELFGHVRGAFTGALDKRVGRFELADGGTIFLDEVGELPLETQVKLLRVLQEHEFEPVGSSRTIRVDVRVIAASNRDLEAEVREGRFRADLLYRLNVFPVKVPPLRERRSDIPLLSAFFVQSLSKKLGKPLEGFSARGMERLTAYSWPGNVRELENIVERAAILGHGPILEADASFFGAAAAATASAPAAGSPALADVERSHIEAVLKSTRGVVEGPRGAAVILGLHPNTLRSRIKKLGISV
jgi:formate hydrogenlyase transcriptional activator